jgi:hypothetical protein
MSSYAGGGSNGGGSAYARPSGPTSPSAPDHNGGLLSHLGPVGNLLGDVKDTVLGIPNAAVQTVEHPIGTAKEIGRSYETMYGPLFHGDISGFLHNVGEHPLGPLLDVATLLTLGGAAGARLGLADARRSPASSYAAPPRSPATPTARSSSADALAEPGDPEAPGARRQALKALPAGTPVVGELARFGRELRRGAVHVEAGRLEQIRDYTRAYANLDKNERIALGVLARLPLPTDFASWKTMLAHEAGQGRPEAARS